jgi:hypothetical protein
VSALFALAVLRISLQQLFGSGWLFRVAKRLFRALYDNVRNLRDEEIDFSMDTSIVKNRYDMGAI